MKKALTPSIAVLILSVALAGRSASAQENVTKVGTTAAKFLTIPIGARALAMGGAFAAQTNDATATFWNPGTLSLLQQNELYFMHSKYFADIGLEYFAAVFPWEGFGTVGISLTSLNMSDMELTTVSDPEGTLGSKFDAGSFAVGLSYGRSLTDKFSIGGTVKYISESIANSKATGIAVDVGTMFTTPFKDIRLGVGISNFGQKMRISGEDLLVQKDIDPSIAGNNESINAFLSTDQSDLPLNLRIGLAYDPLKTESSRLTLAVDGVHPNDNSESLNVGGEYALFHERFFLRGGYRNLFQEDNENSYTLGFGVNYRAQSLQFRFDYGYADQQHLQGIHQFGFSMRY